LDLLAWARRCLPDHFLRPPSRMHLWLAEQLDRTRSTRGMKVNLLAPRRGAKSTIATLAFPLLCQIAWVRTRAVGKIPFPVFYYPILYPLLKFTS
jgi:hypothetical protein